jgi:DNA-binding transcriptional LysR family regulator
VTLTTTVGFAGLWLLPRLGDFIAIHPEIEVRMSAGNRLRELRAEGLDLAIRYGNRDTMPTGAQALFGETMVPVAHPSLGLRALTAQESLAEQTLLEFDGPYRPWLQWGEWLAARGWAGCRPRGMLRFNQYDQLIHAAVAGQGVALGRRPLVDAMLADGRLVQLPSPQPLPGQPQGHGHGFWLLQAQAQPRPEVRAVIDWVRAQAALESRPA